MEGMNELSVFIHHIWQSVTDVVVDDYHFVHDWAKGSIFFYQLFLSIAAAYIFWIVFNWLPYIRRRKKLRPVFDLDLLQLRGKLFVMIDSVMSQGPFMTTGFYQRKIVGGKLLNYDIRIGLQNKCLNNHYLYDPVAAPFLVPIGSYLEKDADEALVLISKALQLSHFANAKEVLLLERIRQELKRFDFRGDLLSSNPSNPINQVFRPAVSSLTYMDGPLEILYKSFMELQKCIFDGAALSEQQGSIAQVLYLFNSDQYKKCLTTIRKYLSYGSSNDTAFLHLKFKIQCLHRLGRRKELYSVLDVFLSKQPRGESLTSLRNLLVELSVDAGAVAIFRKHYAQDALERAQEVISNEAAVIEQFIAKAKFLSQHFSTLDKRLEPL